VFNGRPENRIFRIVNTALFTHSFCKQFYGRHCCEIKVNTPGSLPSLSSQSEGEERKAVIKNVGFEARCPGFSERVLA
jgi:hypothetical protein